MKPEFLPVDEKNWPRRETFHYFTQQVTPTAFTVNVDVDVTVLRAHLKERGIKMFPALLYLVSRAICALPDFRLALHTVVFLSQLHHAPARLRGVLCAHDRAGRVS